MEYNRQFLSTLINKKVKVTEIPKWGTYLRRQWEEHFANDLSEKEKQSIYFNDFLWHLFSYEKKLYLPELQADHAFNQERKQSCYVFYQHSDDAYILENRALLTADHFKNEQDVYVGDKRFTWTYIRTHERDCGPISAEVWYFVETTKESILIQLVQNGFLFF